MNIKKLGIILAATLLVSGSMVGCNSKEPVNQTEDQSSSMQYIGKEDLKESNDYVLLDVRKAEDYNKSHIIGSYVADQDAAKDGDDESGIANLKTALKEATGSETGNGDEKYALVCYSGKSYAQKATDLMIEMGISEDQIYTLEGGMKDWEAGGDDYKGLLE